MNTQLKPQLHKHSVIWRFVHFFGMHKWNFEFSTGHNEYYECEICGKRDVVYPFDGGYQPIDRDWLNAEKIHKNNISKNNKLVKSKIIGHDF